MKNFSAALKQAYYYAFVSFLGITLLSSCKKDDPYDFKDTIAANVNFINASPDGPAANLFIDNIQRTMAAVSYGNASGYNKTFLGDQDVQIRSTGTETVLASSPGQFNANEQYTYFLVGPNSNLGILAIVDDLAVPAAGKAKIRYINASPNAPSATLSFGNVVLVNAQNFRGVAAPVEVNAGTYALTALSGNSRSAVSTVTLESGKIYTIYAKGNVGGSGAAAFSLGVFVNQ
jgi:hypothetical protein